jgi:MoxR-like ATPase
MSRLLLTLKGPPDIGKTSLARQLGSDTMLFFAAERVWCCNVAITGCHLSVR